MHVPPWHPLRRLRSYNGEFYGLYDDVLEQGVWPPRPFTDRLWRREGAQGSSYARTRTRDGLWTRAWALQLPRMAYWLFTNRLPISCDKHDARDLF